MKYNRTKNLGEYAKKGNRLVKRHSLWNNSQQIIHLYVNENMSCPQIASKFNCSSFLIYQILKGNYIKTMRDRKIWAKRKDIISMYTKDHMSTSKIAEIFDCTGKVIIRILRKHGISIENKGRFKKGHISHNKGHTWEDIYGPKKALESKEKLKASMNNVIRPKRRKDVWNKADEIIRKYTKDGLSTVKIAKQYKCSYTIINNILTSNKILIKRNELIWDKKQEIVDDYKKGTPISKIAYSLNCSHILIRSILIKENITIRPQKSYMVGKIPHNKINLDKDEIIKLYPKFSVPKIADKFSCSIVVIYRILKENNIELKEPKFFLKGRHSSPQTEFKKGQFALDKHPNWNNGSSFEPYGLDFNDKFRRKIRKRDNYRCTICNKSEEELNRKLSIHHIDYNKVNNFKENCASLCVSCHAMTNYNRESWKVYFRKLLFERCGYTYGQEQTALDNFSKVIGENLAY